MDGPPVSIGLEIGHPGEELLPLLFCLLAIQQAIIWEEWLLFPVLWVKTQSNSSCYLER
jgi:hypothetical protein